MTINIKSVKKTFKENNMPKRMSDQEKFIIKSRLKEEAKNLMLIHGIKKATVDELVKRVKIPKGTFYLFYESKELLFFEVINEMQDLLKDKLVHMLQEQEKVHSVETITEVLMKLYLEVMQSGLLEMSQNGDMELLIRKLPEQVVREHMLQDDFHMEKLFELLHIEENHLIKEYSAAFRAIFMSMLYKREVGVEFFEDALRLVLRGLVIQLLEGNQ